MSSFTHEIPVLVVGGGPVGLITALQLARYGVMCMLIERNLETTKWPKMDITNVRSMELLRTLGLADGLRERGVAQEHSFNVLFSTGLGEKGEVVAQWDLPSPDEWRKIIQDQNDGTQPREPYQRCSQALFEAWLKPICEQNPLVLSRFGMTFQSLEEHEDGVKSTLIDAAGNIHTVKSKYVIGCDGGGSRVRKTVGLKSTGGPVPMGMYLVHFKSRDLTRLQKQGQFWHIIFSNGGVIIAQDEIDTWTAHLPIPLDEDTSKIDPKETVYNVLGSHTGRYPIEIDEILVSSAWRANLVVADEYRTEKGRVFLAGDSAHQNIPTGGYGMNMGVGDAYDIGWKLAAALEGYGGEYLLESYSAERRPVAFRNVECSGVYQKVHWQFGTWAREAGEDVLLSQDVVGIALKTKMRDYILSNDGENKNHGNEMGYRHTESPVVEFRDGEVAPEWNPRSYVASTYPGARAPHVFMSDLKTSIHDLFGKYYTVVDFTPDGNTSAAFSAVAQHLKIPLKKLHLPNEPHVRNIWERDVVLIRPDAFVAWRSAADPLLQECNDTEVIRRILLAAVGQIKSSSYRPAPKSEASRLGNLPTFSASVANIDQDTSVIQKLAVFQGGSE